MSDDLAPDVHRVAPFSPAARMRSIESHSKKRGLEDEDVGGHKRISSPPFYIP